MREKSIIIVVVVIAVVVVLPEAPLSLPSWTLVDMIPIGMNSDRSDDF